MDNGSVVICHSEAPVVVVTQSNKAEFYNLHNGSMWSSSYKIAVHDRVKLNIFAEFTKHF